MLVLALDTTTRTGSLALADGDRVLLERLGDPALSHAERLPAALLDLLSACGAELRDVGLFAVAAGPGSFTGLRVGIATMQGLAFTTGKQIVPVSALEALAEAGTGERDPGTVVGVWMDAFRKEVFTALYRVTDGPRFAPGRLEELEPASVGDPARTMARWQGLATPALVVGDGASVYRALVDGEVDAPPLAGCIARMAAARPDLALDPGSVQPFYVRRPDAEVDRERRRALEPEGPRVP